VNKAQRTAALVGFLAVALMLFIPPWMYGRSHDLIGYFFIFAKFHGSWSGAEIDFTRLFVQCAVVAVMTAGVVVFLHKPREEETTPFVEGDYE
jgi:uncharacterized membrane protein YjgN (DUF898 family)